MRESETRFATCPLCEATCGLAIEVSGGEIVKVRGDDEDVFSKGFICPKGASIGELHADPDRISAPMVRRNGELVPASWDEAFAAIDERLAIDDLAHHAADVSGATMVRLRSHAAHANGLTDRERR